MKSPNESPSWKLVIKWFNLANIIDPANHFSNRLLAWILASKPADKELDYTEYQLELRVSCDIVNKASIVKQDENTTLRILIVT